MSSTPPDTVHAAIWEITKSSFNMVADEAYESAVSAYDYFGSKSTWNTIQGSSFQNIIGLPLGGRTNNVMGNDVRIVCPWWGLLKRLYSGPDSEAGWSGLATGVGGDTDMVFGKKTYFTYFSDSVNFEFSNNKIEANYQVDGFSNMGSRALYYAPAIAAVLGALSLTTAILCLKHIWKFSSSDIVGNNASVMKWAMLLVPQIESQLLYLVKFLHFEGAALIPLKISNGDQLSVSSSTTPILEAQMNGLEVEIKYGNQRAENWELNLEEMDFISGENVNLYALSEPSIIAIAEMAGNKAEEVDKSTLTQAESIVEIMKPQT